MALSAGSLADDRNPRQDGTEQQRSRKRRTLQQSQQHRQQALPWKHAHDLTKGHASDGSAQQGGHTCAELSDFSLIVREPNRRAGSCAADCEPDPSDPAVLTLQDCGSGAGLADCCGGCRDGAGAWCCCGCCVCCCCWAGGCCGRGGACCAGDCAVCDAAASSGRAGCCCCCCGSGCGACG